MPQNVDGNSSKIAECIPEGPACQGGSVCCGSYCQCFLFAKKTNNKEPRSNTSKSFACGVVFRSSAGYGVSPRGSTLWQLLHRSNWRDPNRIDQLEDGVYRQQSIIRLLTRGCLLRKGEWNVRKPRNGKNVASSWKLSIADTILFLFLPAGRWEHSVSEVGWRFNFQPPRELMTHSLRGAKFLPHIRTANIYSIWVEEMRSRKKEPSYLAGSCTDYLCRRKVLFLRDQSEK